MAPAGGDETTVDLYLLLGLERGCDAESVRRRYRQLAAAFHPDRHRRLGGEERLALEEDFRAISAAYEVLTNPVKRRVYDAMGHKGLQLLRDHPTAATFVPIPSRQALVPLSQTEAARIGRAFAALEDTAQGQAADLAAAGGSSTTVAMDARAFLTDPLSSALVLQSVYLRQSLRFRPQPGSELSLTGYLRHRGGLSLPGCQASLSREVGPPGGRRTTVSLFAVLAPPAPVLGLSFSRALRPKTRSTVSVRWQNAGLALSQDFSRTLRDGFRGVTSVSLGAGGSRASMAIHQEPRPLRPYRMRYEVSMPYVPIPALTPLEGQGAASTQRALRGLRQALMGPSVCVEGHRAYGVDDLRLRSKMDKQRKSWRDGFRLLGRLRWSLAGWELGCGSARVAEEVGGVRSGRLRGLFTFHSRDGLGLHVQFQRGSTDLSFPLRLWGKTHWSAQVAAVLTEILMAWLLAGRREDGKPGATFQPNPNPCLDPRDAFFFQQRKEALRQQGFMERGCRRGREAELQAENALVEAAAGDAGNGAEEGGLVILLAKYGCTVHMVERATERETAAGATQEEEGGGERPYDDLDVTVALQFFTKDGCCLLPAGSKRHLLGFCDMRGWTRGSDAVPQGASGRDDEEAGESGKSGWWAWLFGAAAPSVDGSPKLMVRYQHCGYVYERMYEDYAPVALPDGRALRLGEAAHVR